MMNAFSFKENELINTYRVEKNLSNIKVRKHKEGLYGVKLGISDL